MVQITNLNRRFTNSRGQDVASGKNVANFTTGPNFSGGIQDAWRGTLDENPLQSDFYQSSYTFPQEAPQRAQQLDELRFQDFGNFGEGNNQFSDKFLSYYTRKLGGMDSAEDKMLVENPVKPELLDQFSARPLGLTTNEESIGAQPAASGNAIVDSNVAGKFPSQDVNV